MRELERQHENIDILPEYQIRALPRPLSTEGEVPQRRLDALVDPELAAELDEALREAEGDPGVTLEELERRLP